jgi:hypothetical protein
LEPRCCRHQPQRRRFVHLHRLLHLQLPPLARVLVLDTGNCAAMSSNEWRQARRGHFGSLDLREQFMRQSSLEIAPAHPLHESPVVD